MEHKTILIVDDTTSNLDILGELLNKFDVVDATSGKDALDIVKEEKIDLILLDIMMPEMDGYEVCITALTKQSNSMQPHKQFFHA